jgi:hypothetical protein
MNSAQRQAGAHVEGRGVLKALGAARFAGFNVACWVAKIDDFLARTAQRDSPTGFEVLRRRVPP